MSVLPKSFIWTSFLFVGGEKELNETMQTEYKAKKDMLFIFLFFSNINKQNTVI